ncbi:conserved hypothetical protein [Hymenobacter roseosalivarius DSM 11622]|uniref:Uncharacterized protein n=1 Tax=Hymenobacter roseosalivarius DSM 11622 TaxID=645990 RepID=A0A1W1W2L1_9BACT|nr:hypothetical protein [Hymenobacter roseosalivarius]SMB99743.1 conserved hypothetical protein [Hymenobacter roseosalivarius DSM 11622]
MSSATRLYDHLADEFEARIRILPLEEGGRLTPAYNGIRWDFRYAQGECAKQYFMLYPDFYDPATGASFRDVLLPMDEWLFARMYGISPKIRSHIHQKMVRPGTSFYCCEGPKIVAEGTVTRITGLFEPRV